jgi:hypothetical protein
MFQCLRRFFSKLKMAILKLQISGFPRVWTPPPPPNAIIRPSRPSALKQGFCWWCSTHNLSKQGRGSVLPALSKSFRSTRPKNSIDNKSGSLVFYTSIGQHFGKKISNFLEPVLAFHSGKAKETPTPLLNKVCPSAIS